MARKGPECLFMWLINNADLTFMSEWIKKIVLFIMDTTIWFNLILIRKGPIVEISPFHFFTSVDNL